MIMFMSIFSVRFRFKKDDLYHYKTAIICASSQDVAKDKLSKFVLRLDGTVDDFKIEKISLSNYDYCVI